MVRLDKLSKKALNDLSAFGVLYAKYKGSLHKVLFVGREEYQTFVYVQFGRIEAPTKLKLEDVKLFTDTLPLGTEYYHSI